MKNSKIILAFVLFAFIHSFSTSAQDGEAPYFQLENAKPSDLPLESNKAEVYISGIIADVTLTQTYRNNSDSILEAIYIFPGSAQSAVYDMEMQIGSRIVKAELKEKQEARKTYENAKKEGKRTSLLEQHRPNVFQMNVANILPGERIQVQLKYTEKILPSFGDYLFTLPTVVGPRFHQASDSNPATFVSAPYAKEGTAPSYTYDIDVFLQSGQPIQKISSTSHQIEVDKFNEKLAHVTIHDTELVKGNKDFTLSYRLSDNSINSGLLLYEHDDENFFLANIQPPNMIAEVDIPAREYIFIVDVSGSMFGFPLDVSKKLIGDLLSSIRPSDRFNMLLFAGTSYMFSDTSMVATKDNIDFVLENLEKQEGGGGTMLLPALEKAIHFPRWKEGLSRSLVVVTDGYISVEKETFELVRNNLDKANVFAFGIGSSTNRFLLEGLANVGQGIPFIVEKEEMACDISQRFKDYISTPSLTSISLRFENFDAYDVEPKSIPDLMGERPINIIGKWSGQANGKIHIDGYYAGVKFTQTINLNDFKPDSRNSALRLLWAREKLKWMDDYRKILYNEEHKAEMLQTSLKYNLLSAYTSFVAVDYEVVNQNGNKIRQVKQTLPLPEGVSNHAIGAEASVKKSLNFKPGNYLTLGDIEGHKNSKQEKALKKVLLFKLNELKGWMKEANLDQLKITLVFDTEGSISKISFDTKMEETLQRKLTNILKDINYPETFSTEETEIIIPLNFKSPQQ